MLEAFAAFGGAFLARPFGGIFFGSVITSNLPSLVIFQTSSGFIEHVDKLSTTTT